MFKSMKIAFNHHKSSHVLHEYDGATYVLVHVLYKSINLFLNYILYLLKYQVIIKILKMKNIKSLRHRFNKFYF